MRGTGKRHGGFAPLLENFCQSETAPEAAAATGRGWFCRNPLKLTQRQPLHEGHE
jgi:hypothetical protein